jgi:mono/diheme cytochrome c family protein
MKSIRRNTARSAALLLSLAVTTNIAFAEGLSAEELATKELAPRGYELAAKHCAQCHAIGRDDESPSETNANTAFRDLQKRFPIKMLSDAAVSGTIEGHDEMPGFDFSLEDIKALLAHIDSLSTNENAKYLKGP